ncbi:TPA: ead/Ea22-like family protein [Enterobacter cloacae]
MSNIDKRALREAAERAESDSWGYDRDEFNEALTPAAVLALLDELEAKDKSISFLKDQLAQLANFNPDWDKLEAATYSLREHMAELTAARKRIAELEAREVKLPKPISVLHRRDFMDSHRSIYAYPEAEVNAALADAGINVAAAGKGE